MCGVWITVMKVLSLEFSCDEPHVALNITMLKIQ